MEAKNNNFQGKTKEQIQKLCKDVWKQVRGEMKNVADEMGVDISGEFHHYNFPKYENPHDVLNPNQITEPLGRDAHEQIHEENTSDPSKKWEGPIDPNKKIELEPYELPQPKKLPPPKPPKTPKSSNRKGNSNPPVNNDG